MRYMLNGSSYLSRVFLSADTGNSSGSQESAEADIAEIRKLRDEKDMAREELAELDAPGDANPDEPAYAAGKPEILDMIAEDQRAKAVHMSLVKLTEEQELTPYQRHNATLEDVNKAAATIGEMVMRHADGIERVGLSALIIVAADLLDLHLNAPGSNGWAAAVTMTNGKPTMHFDRKKLHEELRAKIGYQDWLGKNENKGKRLASIDQILGPAAKAAFLVQTGHRKAGIHWFTKGGKHLPDYNPNGAKKDRTAYQTIGEPFRFIVPELKTPDGKGTYPNTSDAIVPVTRKYIEAQYAEISEGKTLNGDGLVSREKPNEGEGESGTVAAAIQKEASKLTPAELQQIFHLLRLALKKGNVVLALRQNAAAVAEFQMFAATIDEMVDGDCNMLKAEDIAAKRLAAEKAAAAA